MNISELLDELDKTSSHRRLYGWSDKNDALAITARAAVDAEIKALQDAKDDMLDLLKDQKKEIDRLHGIEDRVAELERDNNELNDTLTKYDLVLIRKALADHAAMSETT